MVERHQLSSIDLLPEAADGDIQWAINELAQGRRSDSDILFEFNDRIEVLGLGPISRSAWGRYALKKRKIFGENDEALKISAAFAKEYGPGQADDMTIMLTQMIKVAIYKFIASSEARPKDILEMARALNSLTSAQRTSSGEKQKAVERTREEVDKAFDAAESAMAESGRADGAEVLRKIREEVYGIFDE